MNALNTQWTHTMAGGRRIDPSRPWQRYDAAEAVWQDQNGDTILGIKTSPKEVKHWDGKTYSTKYAVGTMRSVEAFGLGTFSADIKLPKGRNLWPAFWLVGEGEWPDNGEIDIVEGWTNRFGGYFKIGIPQPPYLVPSWNTTTNIHWNDDYQEYWNYDGHKSCGSRRLPIIFSLERPAHNFVNYAVEWRPNKATFLVNGKKVREVGWDVCQHFAGSKMHVVFDLWTESEDFTIESPMVIRNFKYQELRMF